MQKPNTILAIRLAWLSFIALAASALFLATIGVPSDVTIEPRNMVPNTGSAYTVQLRDASWPFVILADGPGKATRQSTVVLLEDGRALGPAHAAHVDVRESGRGRYSYWAHALYFSAQDNSDPRSNGRSYVLKRTQRLAALVAVAAMLPLFVLAALRRRQLHELQIATLFYVATKRWPLRMASLAAAALFLVALYFSVIGKSDSVLIAPSSMSGQGGFAYYANLPSPASPFVVRSPSSGVDFAVEVWEDKSPLSHLQTGIHDEIRKMGAGRFSAQGRDLYFSASDNSDPRTNGHQYSVQRRVYLPAWTAVLAFALLAAFAFVSERAGHRDTRRILTWWRRADIQDRMFWTTCAAILCCGAALRAYWTATLQLPFFTPDTWSYLNSSILHPYLPFNEFRTPGLPLVISAATEIFPSPVSYLIASNLAWYASTVALTVALAQWSNLRIVALFALAYLCFSPKNLTFEYYLMSEHFSRVFFIAYLAAVLFAARRPESARRAALVAAVTAANLLVKPTALVCVVATAMLYAYFWLARPAARSGLLRAGVVSLLIPAATMVAFAAVFDARYGKFGITSFSGANQFSHSGFLIDYDSPRHAPLKAKLKPIMDTFTRDFVAKGEYAPNWFIYGSVDDRIRQAFGPNVSPQSLVKDYLRGQGVEPTIAEMDRVFGDLAWEGVKAHFGRYLMFAMDRALYFMRSGYSFQLYNASRPTFSDVPAIEQHRSAWRSGLRAGVTAAGFDLPETCKIDAQRKADDAGSAWRSGLIDPCEEVPFNTNRETARAIQVDRWAQSGQHPISLAFKELPKIAWFFPAVLLFRRARSPSALRAFGLAAFCGLVTLGYVALHGLINTAEAARLFTPIQDFVVLMFLSGLYAGVAGLSTLMQGRGLNRERPESAGQGT